MDVAEIEVRLRRWFADHGTGIAAAWLFGSVARGTAGEASDVDVAILFERRPASRLDSETLTVEGELERDLGRPVQVVAMNTAPPDLAMRVLRAERLLLDRDRSARIRFEVRTRNEFYDLEPHLRRYRRTDTPQA